MAESIIGILISVVVYLTLIGTADLQGINCKGKINYSAMRASLSGAFQRKQEENYKVSASTDILQKSVHNFLKECLS
jgi:hypothetical protein